MIRTVEMDFQFQPTISGPPETPADLYARACASDKITVDTWRDTWIRQVKENHTRSGPFKDNGIGKLYKSNHLKPCIIVGSGPSLKHNVEQLKDTKGIPVISCLHNYHFLEDSGVTPDYYVTLDAGEITVREVTEGGKRTPDEYWASTKNKKLIAFTGSHPTLIEKWQGEVIWYAAPIPEQSVMDEIEKVEPFFSFVSTGGNVLGASFYIAKAILGSNPIIFTGADFSFSYTRKFHAWDSPYDKNIGGIQMATDVFGHRVCTWGSYYNFKAWTESRCCTVPGIYINATEGGILGSYPHGNIEQIKQMALSDVIKMYALSDSPEVENAMTKPGEKNMSLLF